MADVTADPAPTSVVLLRAGDAGDVLRAVREGGVLRHRGGRR